MPWTNVSLILNSRDRTGGSYNSSKFNAVGQNIIQGQIHSVSVNEINYPYDIPNMQEGYNFFFLEVNGFALPGNFEVTVPVGFYSGTELATAVNQAITAMGAALPTPVVPASMPTLAYDTTSDIFTFTGPVTPQSATYNNWFIASPYTYPIGAGNTANTLGKDIMSIMGFSRAQTPNVNNTGPFNTFRAAGAAPLLFTQYIDICSPELCQYQYFRDGSTTNLARQSDVICRLYISNNVATQEEEGQRPFVIHRQFNNARVMRWSAESSIGQLSIQLYDDCGVPLKTSWEPRPYQITFNAYEQDKDSTTY